MSSSRRRFLQQTLMTGGLVALLESGDARDALAEELATAVGSGDVSNAPHDSKNFWDAFGAVADGSSTQNAPGLHGRGLTRSKQPDNPSGASDRLVDYYHYYVDPKTKESTL